MTMIIHPSIDRTAVAFPCVCIRDSSCAGAEPAASTSISVLAMLIVVGCWESWCSFSDRAMLYAAELWLCCVRTSRDFEFRDSIRLFRNNYNTVGGYDKVIRATAAQQHASITRLWKGSTVTQLRTLQPGAEARVTMDWRSGCCFRLHPQFLAGAPLNVLTARKSRKSRVCLLL